MAKHMRTIAGIYRCPNEACGEEWVVAEAPGCEPWWDRCAQCGHATERIGVCEVPWDTHYYLRRAGKLRTWSGRAE